MKLTQEHIGKTVRRSIDTPPGYLNSYGVVSKISDDGERIWLTGDKFEYANNHWTLVPELVATEQGLSLLEARNADVPFRQLGYTEYWYFNSDGQLVWGPHGNPVILRKDDLTARYELKPEPKKVEVTAEMIDGVWDALEYDNRLGSDPATFKWFLKKELGL